MPWLSIILDANAVSIFFSKFLDIVTCDNCSNNDSDMPAPDSGKGQVARSEINSLETVVELLRHQPSSQELDVVVKMDSIFFDVSQQLNDIL